MDSLIKIMLKYKNFQNESDVCKFVNSNNVKVASICPLEQGKAWVSTWVLFYFDLDD